jgi:hypothetical protein
VLIAYVVLRTGPRWLAVVAGGHAVLTTLVVVVTANHYWLDGVVALALLALAAHVFKVPEPSASGGAGPLSPPRALPVRSAARPRR